MPLAIVDVETTGQSAMLGKVIEVAVLRVEGGKVVRRFESLVNPERYFSPTIEALTGISNRDVVGAPVFAGIARRLEAVLEGAVFVAHNARFDYSFLKSEFAALGRPFSARCLCTVKLSRRLFPEHRHHDLTTVIERCGLTSQNRHRAGGDAAAVLAFLRHIDDSCESERVATALQQVLKTGRLPSGLEPGELDRLPESPGVYTFYGTQEELLYVGKSINIRDRVRAHFSGDGSSSREMEMCMQVRRVKAHPTPGELGALLLSGLP